MGQPSGYYQPQTGQPMGQPSGYYTPTPSLDPSAPPAPPAPPTPNKQKMWMMIGGGVAAVILVGIILFMWLGKGNSVEDEATRHQQELAYNDSIARIKFSEGLELEAHGDSLAALDEAKEIPDHLEDSYIKALNIYGELLSDTQTGLSVGLIKEMDSQQATVRGKLEHWKDDFTTSGNAVLQVMPDLGNAFLARAKKINEALLLSSVK